MLTYPWHRAEIMRNTPDFTPKSAQNAYKQKITVADIVSTTVTDLVAEMGFEPHDLRVMSPTSYRTALLRDMN